MAGAEGLKGGGRPRRLLIQAALRSDAGAAAGVAGSLRALRAQPYGQAIMGVVALGLMAYGLWQLAQARYRRIDAT